MMDKRKITNTALGGLLQNPVFVLVLGMCPVIAKSDTLQNSIGLGLATAFVLLCSNIVISLVRKFVPDRVRLPAYIMVISTFTIVVQLTMAAYLNELYASIGAFIPLIVVNCIILGRAEAFASKNNVAMSALDGLSMGLGFVGAISLLGLVRELLSQNAGLALFAQPSGGFIVLAILIAGYNACLGVFNRSARRRANAALGRANPTEPAKNLTTAEGI